MCVCLWVPFLDNSVDSYPTGPFTISEPRNQEIGEFYVVQGRRTTYFEASKLWKGGSGSASACFTCFCPISWFYCSMIRNWLYFIVEAAGKKRDLWLLWSCIFFSLSLSPSRILFLLLNVATTTQRYFSPDQTIYSFRASKTLDVGIAESGSSSNTNYIKCPCHQSATKSNFRVK